MMNHLSTGLAHLRRAFDSRTEPESVMLIGKSLWSLLLACLATIVFVAIGLGIFDLSATLAVIDQEGTSSEVKLPKLDKAQLTMIADYFADAPARFESAKQATVSVADPSI